MLDRQGHGQGDSRVVFLRAGIYRSGGQDNDSSPRHDACRCLRARGNWHLAMLAANRARALRFPMSMVGSVSPAATALLSTAQHRCCCKVSDPNKDPGKDGTVRMRSWITEYSTAEFSKPLCRVDTQMCVSPLQRPIPSARNHCYADTTLMRQ
ncbi:hypothetical protein CFAM422_011421 [Trichoderma lentiforme]|uniref:Uncharacterized protein n=1 Tax=Trichoderma lentiforme TaxID=1567552 RepID=A0A9P4X4B3_9HYPO|nr:hypothetical protein CFAM422_011421 [Trichoderma lentiforme]